MSSSGSETAVVAGGSVTSINYQDMMLWWSLHSKLNFGILKARTFLDDFSERLFLILLHASFIIKHGNKNISGVSLVCISLQNRKYYFLYLIRLLLHQGDCFENVSGIRNNIRVGFYFESHRGIGFYDKIYQFYQMLIWMSG